MSLSSLSINRPVLATVMSIIIILFGFIGYTFLGIREYPSVDPPVVTVSTTYTGANADVMETQITEPLEGSINGIAGIRSLKSQAARKKHQLQLNVNIDIDLRMMRQIMSVTCIPRSGLISILTCDPLLM